MSELPKLRLKMPDGHKEIRSFEDAKAFFSDWQMLVMIEGQLINSYEGLVKLAGQNSYKNKKSLKVTLMPIIAGG